MSETQQERPRRWRFRLSIRGMMILVAILAIGLAIHRRPVTRWDAMRLARAYIDRRSTGQGPTEVVGIRWRDEAALISLMQSQGLKQKGVWRVAVRGPAQGDASIVYVIDWNSFSCEYYHGPRAKSVLDDAR